MAPVSGKLEQDGLKKNPDDLKINITTTQTQILNPERDALAANGTALILIKLTIQKEPAAERDT